MTYVDPTDTLERTAPTDPAQPPPPTPRSRARAARRVGRIAAAVVLIGFIMAPLVAILGSSVTPAGFWQFPPEGFTLSWYARFFADRDLVRAALISLGSGLFAGVIGTTVAVLSALAIERMRGRGAKPAGVLVLLPLLIPNIALGLGIYVLYIQYGIPINLFTLGCAQLIVVLPVTIRMLMVAVGGVSPNIERAAANLGARPAQVYAKVTLPIIRPSLVAAAIMGFVLAFDDAAIALFVNAPDTVTLPIRMLLTLEHESGPLVAAAGSVLLLSALVLIVVLELTVGLARALGVAGDRP